MTAPMCEYQGCRNGVACAVSFASIHLSKCVYLDRDLKHILSSKGDTLSGLNLVEKLGMYVVWKWYKGGRPGSI